MKLPSKTRQSMLELAGELPPGAARAQCINIANYDLVAGETIADRLRRDHNNADGHLRAAKLMANAGCATEEPGDKSFYGTFTFADGSSF